MKILWLSNKILSEDDSHGTGTWLGAMAQRLTSSGQVTLGNISCGKVTQLTRQDFGSIKQWIVSESDTSSLLRLPSQTTITGILAAVDDFSPDIVHIWGTEYFWGLLTSRKMIDHITLLETQGLKFSIAKVFYGGLTLKEKFACIGLKEIIRNNTIFKMQRWYYRCGIVEKEIFATHRFITVQTPWLESQIKQFNTKGKIFHNDFILRDPFYVAQPWCFSGNVMIFTTAAYPSPFKGLHIAVRAVSILKKRFPNIMLRIAGAHQRKGLRRDGYIAWVNREIYRLGIAKNITWLGPLSASQIASELQQCSAVIIPSFIEGYCLGLAEAMQVGVPSVISFAGGTPCLARDDESALFFPPGDEAMCAYQVERLLTDRDLAIRLSRNARAVAVERNNPDKVVSKQLEIYRQVIVEGRKVL